jgi:diguanylate cyclase (GGDEF)-like protein
MPRSASRATIRSRPAARNRSLVETRDIDPLTGLFNRRHFHEFMRGVVAAERRREATVEAPQNALLLLDLDHFKRINDRFGHATGDAVLIEVARRLRESLRDEDRIVRWGGEEFLIYATLQPNDRIHDIASRLLGAIGSRRFNAAGHSVPMTTSIGYLAQPLPPDCVELSWREAFDLVDMALYLAKSQGRNQGCGIVGLPRGAGGRIPEVGNDLAAASAAGIIELHFLPGPTQPVPAVALAAAR